MSQISKLEEKCKQLEAEIEFHKAAHKQIVDENKIENFNERRIYMLKSQIFQLERQCMLMSKALASRENVLQEIENELIKMISDHQELIANDIKGPSVPVSRSKLTKNIQTMQKVKGSLFKHCTLENANSLQTNLFTSSKFKKHKSVTCFDVCSGHQSHINMQQISNLESDLSKLFATCLKLKENLSNMVEKNDPTLVPNALYSRSMELTTSCHSQLNTICTDLLRLSLLYPNNSKSDNLQTQKYFLLKSQDIIKHAAPISAKVKNIIISMTKVHNYFVHMAQLELDALHCELDYQRNSSTLQYNYVSNLLEVVIQGYKESGKLMIKNVEKPINEILFAWDAVKKNQSETNLRTFLNCFKSNEHFLKSLIQEPDRTNVTVLNDFKHKMASDIQKLQTKFDNDFAQKQEQIKNYTAVNKENIMLFKNLIMTDQ